MSKISNSNLSAVLMFWKILLAGKGRTHERLQFKALAMSFWQSTKMLCVLKIWQTFRGPDTCSHNYPIETLRYCTPYIDPQDRKCNICDSNETGDEHHYLLKCTNQNIINTRQTFLTNIKNTTNQFKDFKDECIIQYCLLLHDQKVIQETAEFIKAVAITYREELEERKEETITITRSGRLVKKPDKLNL